MQLEEIPLQSLCVSVKFVHKIHQTSREHFQGFQKLSLYLYVSLRVSTYLNHSEPFSTYLCWAAKTIVARRPCRHEIILALTKRKTCKKCQEIQEWSKNCKNKAESHVSVCENKHWKLQTASAQNPASICESLPVFLCKSCLTGYAVGTQNSLYNAIEWLTMDIHMRFQLLSNKSCLRKRYTQPPRLFLRIGLLLTASYSYLRHLKPNCKTTGHQFHSVFSSSVHPSQSIPP